MFKLGILITTIIIIGFIYWSGLSINHIVILSMFLMSIIFGALVIADNGEGKSSEYDEVAKPAKIKKNKES
ncbi:MAG: hypothetical protein U0457_19170 [Candidatus Sericytochromatia bacterium]